MNIPLYSSAISGIDFSPHKAEAKLGIDFQFKIEKGEKWERTGRISDHGCGMFTGYRDLNSLLTILENTVESFRQLGADDFDLTMEVLHDGQCNFELTSESLARISKLGLGIAISTYEDENYIIQNLTESKRVGP